MAEYEKNRDSFEPDDLSLEVILQRIFNERDSVAHRAAIWELFHRSGDWETFEKISSFGGERGITAYFQHIIDNLDETFESEDGESDLPIIPVENRDGIRDLYAAPLLSLRQCDWAGSAAAIHEILLNEIYNVCGVDEEDLPFGEATASSLERWVDEVVLFPLSIIEYIAYSDCLTGEMDSALTENYLAFLLTLFFSAQAHLNVQTPKQGPYFSPGEED
ncbi:MAG TPA: hypothetical protein ENF16_07050 [Bacteroidetes bacterium]|nr:hypothetical protein [Bacteroidota bacterium]